MPFLESMLGMGQGGQGQGQGFGQQSPSFSGLGQLFQGLFGHSDRPFKEASNIFSKYGNQAQQYLQPYNQAGLGALPQFQSMLGQMSNPSQFINQLMGQYQESPWAKFQQDQSMRASNNAASASGLLGSTPLTQFAQQNARDISSQDMQNYLKNVLGVNEQALGGYGSLYGTGANAGNALATLLQQLGGNLGGLKYGQEQGKNKNAGNLIGSGLSFLTGGLFG